MRSRSDKRRGTIAIPVALSLIAIIGVAAIALDGGLLLDNHRRVQSAADAAALAAADDLFSNYRTNNGLDSSGTAKASALSTALANGYINDGVSSVVTVNIPPQAGNFVGKAGYAEVIIQFNQKRNFSSIFGASDLPVTGRAVARGDPGNIGVLVLDPHLQGALEIRGTVNVLGDGQLYSNSDNTTPNDAASQGAMGSVYVGPGITVTAGTINVLNSLVADGTVSYTNARPFDRHPRTDGIGVGQRRKRDALFRRHPATGRLQQHHDQGWYGHHAAWPLLHRRERKFQPHRRRAARNGCHDCQ
jgi:hypothetical protein